MKFVKILIICLQVRCTESLFGTENYASCNKNTQIFLTGSSRNRTPFKKDIEEAEKNVKPVSKAHLKTPHWRERGPRSKSDNTGIVECAQWGSCTYGALFAMHNFKKGIVEHAENANGCRFTFYVK